MGSNNLGKLNVEECGTPGWEIGICTMSKKRDITRLQCQMLSLFVLLATHSNCGGCVKRWRDLNLDFIVMKN